MGFTREQIVDTFADIFERFDFDKREHELAGYRTTVSVMD
jgi:hypothetical protein